MKKIFFYLLIGGSFIAQSCINDNEDPIAISKTDGFTVDATVGGAKQPNQVWFDFGTNSMTVNQRLDWDLAFYAGNEFKVMLNSSLKMAATKIPNVTDIKQVTVASVATLTSQVVIGPYSTANIAYIDDVKGNFPSGYTAIGEVKANESENSIYLVNMGVKMFEGNVPAGVAETGTEPRGWMKIQVKRQGNGYKVKYAPLDETLNIKELNITKNPAYNYNFVSLTNDKEVFIQPEKKNWDIGFTVFTNVVETFGTYSYADFVIINNLGGAGAYEVQATGTSTGAEAYNNFKFSDIDQSKFVYKDQRVIGGNWREAGPSGSQVKSSVFYIIKDAEGYYFKMRFKNMTDEKGERGHPQFEYKPLF